MTGLVSLVIAVVGVAIYWVAVNNVNEPHYAPVRDFLLIAELLGMIASFVGAALLIGNMLLVWVFHL